jgi:hypothetical protein
LSTLLLLYLIYYYKSYLFDELLKSKLWIDVKHIKIWNYNLKNSLGRPVENFLLYNKLLRAIFCYLSPSQRKLKENIYTACTIGSANIPSQQMLHSLPRLVATLSTVMRFPWINSIGKFQLVVPLLSRDISWVYHHIVVNYKTCKSTCFVWFKMA